ncbi:hypothetical protein [Magnetospira sp. QH-2]|uniref:hypothetical protein n=1 Tax=Magnetospira sp. (strain QH-2) TaxID=1288970 RepID=UPI0003E80DF2|nr:hypothetical protein [Magnetospira sp. QH-2]CCQ72620.1 conserved protein of unknown function [Magnetospira sp. QH-2]
MKTAKLIHRLGNILDLDDTRKKKVALKKVLKKLKHKEVTLQEKLRQTKSDKDSADLKRQIKVSKAQRKKGIKTLRKLKGKS